MKAMNYTTTNSSTFGVTTSTHNLTNFYIGLSKAVISAFIMSLSYIFKKLSLNRLIILGKRAGKILHNILYFCESQLF